MVPRVLILALLGLVLAAHGCNRPMVIFSDDNQRLPAPSGGPLVPQGDSPVPDVPMPDGFVVIEARSRASRQGSARVVDEWYQGRANDRRIVDFYHEQLAHHGWDKLSDDQARGDTTVMHYYKAQENLELHISKPDRVATIQLLIHPRTGPNGPRPEVP